MPKVDIQEIQKVFNENYPDLKLEHIDQEKIVVSSNIHPKTAIYFNNTDYDDIDQKKSVIKNKKLKIFNDIGFQLDNYLEILMKYSVTNYELCSGDNDSHCETFDLNNFIIGDNKIEIAHPSDMFKLIFLDYESDDFFTGWEDLITIKIIARSNNNLESLLQQSLFWIQQMCPSVYDTDYPKIATLCYESSEGTIYPGELPDSKKIYADEYRSLTFKESINPEPIYFYNAARSINDLDISFLYFYKILEFYFILAQKKLIKSEVDKYNLDHKLDRFITNMYNEYFGKNELALLRQLVSEVYSKDFIDDIVDESFKDALIIENNTETFCSSLYDHRNSIVHGKFEYKKINLDLPNTLNNKMNKLWTEIIEKLSFYLINKFCYEK